MKFQSYEIPQSGVFALKDLHSGLFFASVTRSELPTPVLVNRSRRQKIIRRLTFQQGRIKKLVRPQGLTEPCSFEIGIAELVPEQDTGSDPNFSSSLRISPHDIHWWPLHLDRQFFDHNGVSVYLDTHVPKPFAHAGFKNMAFKKILDPSLYFIRIRFRRPGRHVLRVGIALFTAIRKLPSDSQTVRDTYQPQDTRTICSYKPAPSREFPFQVAISPTPKLLPKPKTESWTLWFRGTEWWFSSSSIVRFTEQQYHSFLAQYHNWARFLCASHLATCYRIEKLLLNEFFLPVHPVLFIFALRPFKVHISGNWSLQSQPSKSYHVANLRNQCAHNHSLPKYLRPGEYLEKQAQETFPETKNTRSCIMIQTCPENQVFAICFSHVPVRRVLKDQNSIEIFGPPLIE